MLEFFDFIIVQGKYVVALSAFVAIFGGAILFNAKKLIPKNEKKYKLVGGLMFAQLFVVVFLYLFSLFMFTSFTRKQVRSYIDSGEIIININNTKLDSVSSKKLKQELRKIGGIPAHHSWPIGEISIELIKHSDTIRLTAKRDSDIEGEFWIFYPKFELNNEVGRMKSAVLGEFVKIEEEY